LKPRSIISLIVSAVLILCGIITCVVASSIAEGDGVMLFPEADKNGDLVYKMELKGTTKISVNAAGADVSVVGGAEKSVIEVVNFNANYYKLSQSNGALSFVEVDDFFSMFKFWDNGFSFKGMRYLLRFGDDTNGPEKIIIRLADGDDIKSVNITSDSGDISVEDCSFNSDYTIRANSGKVDISDIESSHSFNISGKDTDLSIENCKTSSLKVNGDVLTADILSLTSDDITLNAKDGSVNIADSGAKTLTASLEKAAVSISPYKFANGSVTSTTGKVTLGLADTDSLAASVSTTTGKICVNGEFTEGFSKNTPDPNYRFSVVTGDGDVYITHP